MWFRSNPSSNNMGSSIINHFHQSKEHNSNSKESKSKQQQTTLPSSNSRSDLKGKGKNQEVKNSRTIVRIRSASPEKLEGEELESNNDKNKNSNGNLNSRGNIYRSNQPIPSTSLEQDGFEFDEEDLNECNCGEAYSSLEEDDSITEHHVNNTCGSLSLSQSSISEEGDEDDDFSSSLPSLSHSIRMHTPLFEDDEDDYPLSFSPQSDDLFLYSESTSSSRSLPDTYYIPSTGRKTMSTAKFDPLISPLQTFDLNSPALILISTSTTTTLEPIITKNTSITTDLVPSIPTSSALTKSLLKLVRLPNLSLPKLPPLLQLSSSNPLPSSTPSSSSVVGSTTNSIADLVRLDLAGEDKVEESWSCELHEFEYEYECERGWDWGRSDRESSKSLDKECEDEVEIRSPPLSPTTTTISLPPLAPVPSSPTKSELRQQQRQQQQHQQQQIHYQYSPPRLISNQRHLLMLSLEISMIHSGKILFPLRQRAVTIIEGRGSCRGGAGSTTGSCLKFEVV